MSSHARGIRYIAPFGQNTGYGQAAHDYLSALVRAEIPVDINPMFSVDSDTIAPRYQHLVPHVNKDMNHNVVLIHTIPYFADVLINEEPTDGRYKVLNTTWETDKLPQGHAEKIEDSYNLCLVPSQFNKEVFLRSGVGVKCKLYVVPHVFDPNWWWEPWSYRILPPRPYTFYSICVWAERKNPIGLLKAYLTEFTREDDVLLRVITPSMNQEDLHALILAIGIPLDELPKFEFIGMHNERLTDEQLRQTHIDSDCYVSVTRGEGWGLGAFEACLVGNPVVHTNWSGPVDFLAKYPHFYPVPFTITPAVTQEPKLTKNAYVGRYKIHPRATQAPIGITADQSWAEPDLAACKRAMRYVYEHRLPKLDSKRYCDVQERFRSLYSYESVGSTVKQVFP